MDDGPLQHFIAVLRVCVCVCSHSNVAMVRTYLCECVTIEQWPVRARVLQRI